MEDALFNPKSALLSDAQLLATCKRISFAASTIALWVGGIVLLGWVFDWTLIKNAFSGTASMKVNTAIGFMLSGTALRLLGHGAQRLAQTAALMTAAVGLLTLSEYLWGWDLEIDQLLFRDQVTAIGYPGRMGINTAISFLLVGSALWLLSQKTRRSIGLAQIFSLAAALIALQALVGYAYDVREFYKFGGYAASMAIHTALTFVVLCVGILVEQPNRGLMYPLTGTWMGSLMARRVLPWAVVLPVSIGWLILKAQQVGAYEIAFGMSLLVIALTVVIVALLWRNAHRLNELDRQRSNLLNALAETNYRLTLTLESTTDGFIALDREWRFIYVNRQAEQLFQKPRQELLHQNFWDAFPEAIDSINELFHRAIAEQNQIEEEVHYAPLDLWIEVHAFPAPEGLVVYFKDIRDRKRVERELAELLQREQAAREQAETANRMKDEFLAVVSHELRSPLNAMLGWMTLLRTREFDQATKARAMETVERNARAQAQLVEDLLDISRTIQGQLRLNVRSINPVSVIEAAIDTVRPAADAKMIRLQPVLDPTAAPISGDSDRLQQVVWNLLSNAIKFTPKGGRVQVCLQRINSHVEIIVSDTGQGISPEFLPYVFDRFRQADSSITRRFSGLGLGLSIVRHLVELHGGTIEVESSGVGQGATFTVKLPRLAVRLEDQPERLHPTVETSLSVPLSQPPDLHGLRILVVDDEADARELVAQILTQYGAEVIEAATADQVVMILSDRSQPRPDLFISDIGMPDQDGYTLLRRVRSLEPTSPRIPAVALTAFARSEDRKAALMAGFQSHVAKPVDPSELVVVVANLVGRTD